MIAVFNAPLVSGRFLRDAITFAAQLETRVSTIKNNMFFCGVKERFSRAASARTN